MNVVIVKDLNFKLLNMEITGYLNDTKLFNRYVYANSADPDEIAALGAI